MAMTLLVFSLDARAADSFGSSTSAVFVGTENAL